MKSPEHNPASAETACLRIGDEDPANLVRLSAEAASALIRGDIDTYLTLIRHTSDYTPMAPFGGAPTRGFDTSPDRLAQLRRYFQGGRAELELVCPNVAQHGRAAVWAVLARQKASDFSSARYHIHWQVPEMEI